MKPEVKKEWVAALRSGAFKQTTGALQRVQPGTTETEPVGYCCLGVLCEVTRRLLPDQVHAQLNEDDGTVSYTMNGVVGISFLPAALADWVELGWLNDPRITHNGESETLSALNDAGFTFAQIADLIEEQL